MSFSDVSIYGNTTKKQGTYYKSQDCSYTWLCRWLYTYTIYTWSHIMNSGWNTNIHWNSGWHSGYVVFGYFILLQIVCLKLSDMLTSDISGSFATPEPGIGVIPDVPLCLTTVFLSHLKSHCVFLWAVKLIDSNISFFVFKQ